MFRISIYSLFGLWVGKLCYFLLKLLSRSGSTLPGELALRLSTSLIEDITHSSIPIIIIAGTNGKTTTSSIICFLLEKSGIRVIHNYEGANMLNGIASALIRNTSFLGKVNQGVAVFEVDENAVPHILSHVKPTALILLNLFRDQLDRYGEVNTIAKKWKKSVSSLSSKTTVYINGDDPQLVWIAQNISAPVVSFGIDTEFMTNKRISHDADSLYCPLCSSKLQYSCLSYSHLGIFTCPTNDFSHGKTEVIPQLNQHLLLRGIYNLYNATGAVIVSEQVFHISRLKLLNYLAKFTPVFGRQEVIQYQNRYIQLILSKNPAGLNQSIEVIREIAGKSQIPVLCILNDRIPDGRDVSWIWDAEVEKLASIAYPMILSGDRSKDMLVRCWYAFNRDKNLQEYADLSQAISALVKATQPKKKAVILATYSAMLELRRLIIGTSFYS